MENIKPTALNSEVSSVMHPAKNNNTCNLFRLILSALMTNLIKLADHYATPSQL